MNSGCLLISCPDRPGIVAAVSRFLFQHGANITESAQHSTDPIGGMFFMRTEFHLDDLDAQRQEIEQSFQRDVAERFNMEGRISTGARDRASPSWFRRRSRA